MGGSSGTGGSSSGMDRSQGSTGSSDKDTDRLSDKDRGSKGTGDLSE